MAISTGTQDYREPSVGSGGGIGGWPDTGTSAEAAVIESSAMPAINRLAQDLSSQTSLAEELVPETPPEPVVVIPETPVQAVTGELGTVAMDTAKLVELQLQLFGAECSQNVQRLTQPAQFLGAGIAIGAASLIVLFHAMGWALHDVFGLSVSLSLFLVAVLGAILTAIALQAARTKLTQAQLSFAKSKAELIRNVECLGTFWQPLRK